MKKVLKWGCIIFFIIPTIFALISILFIDEESATKTEKSEQKIEIESKIYKENKDKDLKNLETEEKLPKNLNLNFETGFDSDSISYIIYTNIPLPVELMASLDAKDLKPNDPAIGLSRRIKIEKSPSKFTFLAKNDYEFGKNPVLLQSGDYVAEVTFYPNWGAENGNPISKSIKNKLSSSKDVKIKSYGSILSQKEKDKKQSWGIDINIYDEWNETLFVENLGKFKELETIGRDPNIVKTFYFPEADMTFFISKPLNQVLIWKIGKVNEF